MVNRLLADWLSWINAFIAIIIASSVTFIIIRFAAIIGLEEQGSVIIGPIIGLVVAVIICGWMAVILDMRRAFVDTSKSLKDLVNLMQNQKQDDRNNPYL